MVQRSILLTLALVLSACSSNLQPPEITFIGVSEGTQDTPSEELIFQDRYEQGITDITSAVQFGSIADGSMVRAMWFSPDDRRPPFGARNLPIASGANLARFSVGHDEELPKGPYMLQVFANTKVSDEQTLTASGSVQFFVGMTDEEVAKYLEEYDAWVHRER